jgi:hypothetical protein
VDTHSLLSWKARPLFSPDGRHLAGLWIAQTGPKVYGIEFRKPIEIGATQSSAEFVSQELRLALNEGAREMIRSIELVTDLLDETKDPKETLVEFVVRGVVAAAFATSGLAFVAPVVGQIDKLFADADADLIEVMTLPEGMRAMGAQKITIIVNGRACKTLVDVKMPDPFDRLLKHITGPTHRRTREIEALDDPFSPFG